MRSLVSGFAASLDGYIEGPDGAYDWILIDPEIDFGEELKRFDTLLYGRRTYEVMKAMPPAKGFAHYVCSTSLTEVDPPYRLLGAGATDEIGRMKEAEGKDIALYGGASLLASLLEAGLVDEIAVSVIPVILGSGKPMVEALSRKRSLKLLRQRTFGNGTIQLTYAVQP